jgi:hypothetical protein
MFSGLPPKAGIRARPVISELRQKGDMLAAFDPKRTFAPDSFCYPTPNQAAAES